MHPDLTDGGWRAKLLRGTGGSGVVAIALGIVVERFGMPISKILWTPSFLFIASGVGLLVFGMAFWSVDLEPEMAKRLLEVRKGWISRRRSGVLRSRPVSYVSDGGRSMSPDATVSPETSPPPARRRRHDKIPPLMMARFMVLHALIAVGRNPLLVYVVSSLIEVVLWWSVPGGIAPRYLAGILFEGCGFTVLPFGVSSLVWSAVWTVGVVVPMAVVLDARGVYWTV
ncbi:hypothetical protein BC829DRAFT_388673 [Chytridium lagenaria]|nr:hypothetical protein BC829DRAFT_388673 [Chytridium lagenaria]